MTEKKYRLEWRRYKHPLENVLDMSDEEAYESDFNIQTKNFKGHVLYGSNGIIPVNKESLPNKSYNLWVADSNFRLPKQAYNILDFEVEGVEGWECITPYQLLIGVARLFDEDAVKANIEEAFCKYMKSTEVVVTKKNHDNIKNVFKHTAIVNDEDTGLFIILSGNTKEELSENIKNYLKSNPKAIVEEQNAND